jgi:hypothetical protein
MTESAIDSAGELGSGGEQSKQFRLPSKNINREYLISCLLALRDFDAIIKNMQRLDDPRFRIMARQIVNRILDDDIRYSLLTAFDLKLKEIADSNAIADVQSANIITASQDIVGEVNSYLDNFFALHKGQVIGDV